MNRKYIYRVSHEPPAWHQVPALPPSRAGTPVLGLSASGFAQSNLFSRDCKLGSRPPVQDWSSPRRVGDSSRSGSSPMDLVWYGSDRPICISRDNPLQDVVLPEGSGRSPGFGCTVSTVAERIVVRFPSISSDSTGTQQGHPGPLQGAVKSPPIAKQALVPSAPSLGSQSTLGPAS